MAVRPQQAEKPAQQQEKPPRETRRLDAGPGSLAGNLTRDPELRYTPSGKAVCSLRVAVQERVYSERKKAWEDKDPEFFDVTCWAPLAEHVAESLQRGQRIVAEGRWEAQSWEDTEGTVQERTVLVAADLGPSCKWTAVNIPPRRKS